MTQKQESRCLVVALKVTPTEKRRLKGLAAAKGTDVSNLLREMGLDEILAEHERITAALAEAA